MIVVDPRRTLLAKAADIHLQLRPGTDTALALAFLNVIITEGLYDKDFVEKYTIGFDKLAEHVKQYSPETVAEITWVPADKIRAAARMYATSKPAAIFQGNCLDNMDNGFQGCRALDILVAITGNLDTRGGSTLMPFHIFEKLAVEDTEREGLPLPQVEPAGKAEGQIYYEVLREPMAVGLYLGMVDEKPYPIKGLLVQAGNPVITLGDTNKFKRGVDKLDFMAVHDIFMTETAELADIVLPSATFLEQQLIYQYVGRPMIVLLQEAIEPPEDCWPNWKVWLELGKRMGYEKYLPWQDVDEFENEAILKPLNVTVDDLKANPGGYFFKKRTWKKYETEGLATPSGKVEIYSEQLEKKGFDPLPTYHEPLQSPVSTPEIAKKYPLILITGQRALEYLHSTLRGVPTLRGKNPEPMVEINTETAQKFGIASGDRVIVETQFGMCEGKAAVTRDIHPQVVSVPHGWGGSANQNYLTSWDIRDPEIGVLACRALQCRIRNADPSQAPKVTTMPAT
jgi:anaerobic selenocysteine-containing dehydrogenase